MNIKIDVHLKAPEVVEAINGLTKAFPSLVAYQGNLVDSTQIEFAETTVKEEPKKTVKKKSKNSTSTDEANSENDSNTKAVTLEEVRAKLAVLSQDGKQTQVKALITKFGASKLSDIPSEQYGELLEEAEAL